VNCTGHGNVQKNFRSRGEEHAHVLRNDFSYTPDPGEG
jgi:hypothetical protein